MKHPNIYVSFYDGDLDIGYDCIGALKCPCSLCDIMPPQEDECCVYRDHGSCRNVEAQKTAMEAVARRIKTRLKKEETD